MGDKKFYDTYFVNGKFVSIIVLLILVNRSYYGF